MINKFNFIFPTPQNCGYIIDYYKFIQNDTNIYIVKHLIYQMAQFGFY